MADLTASCWTIDMLPTNASASIIHPDVHGFITGKLRTTRVRASLNNAATDLVYPAGGVPLPTFNATTPAGEPSYGMRRNLSYLIPVAEVQPSVSVANAVVWKYAASGGAGAMRAYHQRGVSGQANAIVTELIEVPTTFKITTLDDLPAFEFQCIGW